MNSFGNNPPVANDDSASTSEDTTVTIDVLHGIPGADSDPDTDDVLTSLTATDPANGVVSLNSDGTFDYTPDPNFVGQDSFAYTISDGNGGTATATGMYRGLSPKKLVVYISPPAIPLLFVCCLCSANILHLFPFPSLAATIDIVAVNDAPVANDDSVSTSEDTPVTVNVLGNDSDPEGHVLNTTAVLTGPSSGAVTINSDGTILYTPNNNFFGQDTFVYSISDGNGGTATATGEYMFLLM